MADERVRIFFPGIEYPIGASYTLSYGTDPGRIRVQCLPQSNKSFQVGPFTITWMNTIVKIPDCRILADNVVLDGNGFVTSVEMEDYRWKWRYPTIDGWYNVRNAYQSIYGKTKKNPQELARLLMKAMGIVDSQMNVAALPTDDYPFMEWYSANAANELSSLAERYGCRVAPWPDGRVNIYKLGVGNPLPANLPTATDSSGVITPSGPDSLEVHYGPTKYRIVCDLVPVGIDVDGKVKDINNLSYKPAAGWGWETDTNYEVPGFFPKLLDSLNAKYGTGTTRVGKYAFIMDLARRSLFKWFRINLRMPGGIIQLKIPGYDKTVESLAQLLPIDDRVQNISLDPEKPAVLEDASKDTDLFWDAYDQTTVWGEFFKRNANGLTFVDPDTAAFTKPVGNNFYNPGGYSIDRERGIVQFDDYVYSRTSSNQQCWPRLAISFMCSPRERDTGKLSRYVVKRTRSDITLQGTKPLVLIHPEWQLVKTFDLTTTGTPGPVREVNKKTLDKVGNYYIDAELRKFRKQEPRTKSYNGLWPVFTDGAIREVTFTVSGESGVDTIACYNDERQPYVLPYEQRRRDQRIKANLSTDQYAPPVFTTQPQTFPYNLSSAFINAAPSRR